jgi:hypothetical protein
MQECSSLLYCLGPRSVDLSATCSTGESGVSADDIDYDYEYWSGYNQFFGPWVLIPEAEKFTAYSVFLFFHFLFFSLSSSRLDNTRGTFADSGTYALMGAAGSTYAPPIDNSESIKKHKYYYH